MSAIIIELAVSIILAIAEMTVQLAIIAIGPIRFLFSHRYRATVRQSWAGRPRKRLFDVTSGAIVASALFVAIAWWCNAVF
jgi:hypothetical protein